MTALYQDCLEMLDPCMSVCVLSLSWMYLPTFVCERAFGRPVLTDMHACWWFGMELRRMSGIFHCIAAPTSFKMWSCRILMIINTKVFDETFFLLFFLIKSISSDSRAIIVSGDTLPILFCEGNTFVLETTNIPIYSQQENIELEEQKCVQRKMWKEHCGPGHGYCLRKWRLVSTWWRYQCHDWHYVSLAKSAHN